MFKIQPEGYFEISKLPPHVTSTWRCDKAVRFEKKKVFSDDFWQFEQFEQFKYWQRCSEG